MIQENIIDKSDRGITAVNVVEDLICKHSFIIYVDKNLTVRDSFACDFKVTIPEVEIETDSSLKSIDFDLEIIRYNLLPNLLSRIIISVLSKQKIIVISDIDHLNIHFNQFFNYILDGSFKSDICFITKAEYKSKKKQFKNFIVLEGVYIVNDKRKILDSKTWKIIYSIVQRFYSESDPELAIIIIKNELYKLFKLSEALITFNGTLTENEDLTSKVALDYVNKQYNTKIQFLYLKILMDIIDKYFQVNLKKPPSSADLLGYNL